MGVIWTMGFPGTEGLELEMDKQNNRKQRKRTEQNKQFKEINRENGE